MALSVLRINYGYEGYGLYDSITETFLLKGTQEELFDWKHLMEEVEQQKSNEKYLQKLKSKYRNLLIKAGHTEQTADKFLKEKIPGLYV